MILMLVLCCLQQVQAQDYSLYKTPQDWVIAKNYFATSLLIQDTTVIRHVLDHDKSLKRIFKERLRRYKESEDCKDVHCFLSAFRWSEAEVESIVLALSREIGQNGNLQKYFREKLLPSHRYGISKGKTVEEYIEKAFRQDLRAMNYVIDVYAGGRNPNYPKIDSISFNIHDPRYLSLLKDVQQDVLSDVRSIKEVFDLTLLTAVRLLEINERWDAAQLEPLLETENRKAYEAVSRTDFNKYPYSLLLTLGAGPEKYDQPISPGGMLRSRMAARSYFDGLAPFIVVSGGRVHPYKTKYIEALEMKRYLMETLLIPEEAILIDPHARHTTTNIRNTARIMLQYGFPEDKSAIINSSEAHINAVEQMADRCLAELGYVPYELGRRINEVIIEFKPKIEALTIDYDEPLDP